MRVLMVCPAYLPDSVGGTERVAHGLATALSRRGVEVEALVESDREPYRLDGIPVNTLAPPGPRQGGTDAFDALMARFRPDVVHFHAWAQPGLHRYLQSARASGCRTVATYHVPGITCLQRGLMFRGREICDGGMRVARCTTCRAHAFGRLPRPIDWLVGAVPLTALSRIPSTPVRRVARLRADTAASHAHIRRWFSELDVIHVSARWALDLVAGNGAPRAKLRHVRPGLIRPAESEIGPLPVFADPWTRRGGDRPFRLLFWGRLDYVKGVQTVIRALRLVPDLPLEFLVVGIAESREWEARLKDEAGQDARITFAPSVAPDRILPLLRSADLGVVPSIWFETGPLTVLEAQAAGLPILGSRRGGIAELVDAYGGGVLFPPGDAPALARILVRLVNDPAELAALRAEIREPRTIEDVAAELLAIYRETSASELGAQTGAVA